MKVVKLNRNFKYSQYGFTHGLKFEYADWQKASPYRRWLINKYGSEPWRHRDNVLHPFISYAGSTGSYKQKNKPMWILVKDPHDITIMALTLTV